jgi:hypothetical protein
MWVQSNINLTSIQPMKRVKVTKDKEVQETNSCKYLYGEGS